MCQEYFDLTTDYDQMKQILSTIDDYLAQSVTFGQGIRILKQDVWETLISFIISANNNIPRIKGIIERLSAYYGTKIEWNGVSYYTFPTPEQLSRATIPDLRKLGLGFRDKRVYQTTQMVQNKTLNLEQLQKEGDLQQLRTTLLQVPGVGPKADCVLLFGFQKREVFPVDVWVRRVMNEIYLHETEEEKVTKEKIQQIARQKYGNLAGIAQQYLFYWEREKSKVS